jgi:hypothetical protein
MTPIPQNIPEWVFWTLGYFALNVCLLAWSQAHSDKRGGEVVILAIGLPLFALAVSCALVLLILKGPNALKKYGKENDPDNVIKFRGKE